jgi:hypothetical protein
LANGYHAKRPGNHETTEQTQIVLLELILVLVVVLPIPENGEIKMKKSAAQDGQIAVGPCDIRAPRSLGDYLAGFCSQS